MSLSPIYIGIVPGMFVPQEGTSFRTTQWGFDEGERRWLTHPSTPDSSYPQRSQRDSQYTGMYVTDVVPRQHESGLIEVTAIYKGLKSSRLGLFAKERITPGADVQMMSIGILDSGTARTLLAPVPKDTCVREYVTTAVPDLAGVGANYGATFLPVPTIFSITFVPDPDATPPPKNYRTGWVLDSRTWDNVASSVFLVREHFSYYHTIGG